MTRQSPLYGLPWAMRQREGAARGRCAVPAPDDPGPLRAPWPFKAAGPVPAAPVVDHTGCLYVPTEVGVLHRVEPTGLSAPILTTGAALRTSPALAVAGRGGTSGGDTVTDPPPASVYAADADGELHCVRSDGTPMWSLRLGAGRPVRSAPAVHRTPTGGLSRIWLGDDDGRLYGVVETAPDAARTDWTYTVAAGMPVRTSPVVSPDGVTVRLASADGHLHVLDAATGIPLYASVRLSASPLWTPAFDEDAGDVTYITGQDGMLRAVERGGQELWALALGRSLYAGPAIGPDGTVLAVADGALHAVSAQGTLLWSEPLPPRDRYTSPPVVDSSGVCLVTSDGGLVVAVRTDPGLVTGDRALWQVRPSTSTLTGAVLDGHGRVFVGDRAGRVHALDDSPAYKVFAQGSLQAAGDVDVYSLREVYGVPEPARTLRLTGGGGVLDGEPTTSLDRSVIAHGARPPGEVRTATPRGMLSEVLAAGRAPAFTPVDDATGRPKAPHTTAYVALTGEVPGGGRRLSFVRPDTGAARSFTAWAAALGVPAAMLGQLEPAGTEQSHPAFSPDGRKLAWRQWDPSNGSSRLWLLRLGPAGWDLTPVGPWLPYDPEHPEGGPDEPAFSPDSGWIAVREGLSVAIHDVVGSRLPVYTSPGKGRVPCHPAWAPDGSELAMGVRDGAATDVWAASGPGYARYAPLTTSGDGDEPAYDFFQMPPPERLALDVDRQVPDAQLRVLGRGFDLLHPANNVVEFTHTLRVAPLRAPVQKAEVDPVSGLGVLTVRVPRLAGHGPVTVRTRYGSASTPDFHVLPAPARLVQRRTVPGARIRVFGRGFDLSPASAHTVFFGSLAAGAERGEAAGDEEFLVVTVPAGVTADAEVRVANGYGEGPCPQRLGLLTPTLSLLRTVDSGAPGAGLPSYATQGGMGVEVRVRGADFPYDPYFGYGVGHPPLLVEPVMRRGPVDPVEIRRLGFRAPGVSGAETADVETVVFPFPGIGTEHPGGALRVSAADPALPAARAECPFRVPETDIPIVFVPGTSGTSLDLAPGTPTPVLGNAVTDFHFFPWLSKTPVPWPLDPFGPLFHSRGPFSYNPSAPGALRPADPRGPRIWGGVECAAEILAGTLNGNIGNHYLDLCAFGADGLPPADSKVVPGTVLQDVLMNPPLKSGSAQWGFEEVYKPFVDFLRKADAVTGWPGRPLCLSTDPATGTCVDETGAPVSGHNAVYLFNMDWRRDIPTEAGRLAAFIDAVRARPDVDGRKVVVITHSYGGPVARAYYLDPANAAEDKVDQVISLGGGFLGVIEPFNILEQGSSWGLGWSLGPIGFGVQPWQAQSLAQNWPTAYFQLPNSEEWFADHGTAVGGRLVDRSYVRDYRWFPTAGAGELTTCAESNAWIRDRHNPTLTDAFTSYTTTPAMGDFRSGTGAVYHHRIIGKGRMDTTVAVALRSLPSLAALFRTPVLDPMWWAEIVPTTHWEAVHGDGDSTVPYHGAIGLTLPQDDRVYVIDGIAHSQLPNAPQMIGKGRQKGLLQLLLEGAVVGSGQAPPPFMTQNQVTEDASLLTALAGDESADRWGLELRGAATLDITDHEARHLGPHPELPALVEEGIPGATLHPDLAITSAFLPEGRYEVRVTPKKAGVVRLHVRPYRGATALAVLLFREAVLQADERAVLHLDAATGTGGEAWLEIRSAEDGSVRDRVAADVLSAVDAADTAPPRTTVTLAGGTVEAMADDGPQGSGVYRTWLTLDGAHHEPYGGGPVPVPDDAVVVMAYSEDGAGNLEYPGWALGALGLGERALRFRLEKQELTAAVEVRNLDPLGVTAPIAWQAGTDARWLRLSPTSGTTPGSLRVEVLPDELPDNHGDFTAQVRVTVTDDDALFRTRELTVRVHAG
ncbi:outer membrane protein assembly factor BamB family protein [Streptomyces chartreusis]